jgi:hypothetical protein
VIVSPEPRGTGPTKGTEIEQFIALNLYELGKFALEGRRVAVGDFVARYHEIIDDYETDPGLKIEFKQLILLG